MWRAILLATALAFGMPAHSDETANIEIYEDRNVLDGQTYESIDELKRAIVAAGSRRYGLVMSDRTDPDRAGAVVSLLTELFPDIAIVAGGHVSGDDS